jgi:alkylated DNA repair dioxygenase AlkB
MDPDHWVRLVNFWPTEHDEKSSYQVLLDEIREDLNRGTIKVGGRVCQEARLTAMYSQVDGAVMKYSGRKLEPRRPVQGGYVDIILDLVNDPEFRDGLCSDVPQLRGVLPNFNAVFINWYRPPSLCGDKMDNIGIHSDDTTGMQSDVIISITLCEPGGERLFSMHDKAQGDKIVWQAELNDGDIIVMLPGCQRLYKHSVSSRKTHLDRSTITGGRLNITLRSLKLE